MSGHRSIDQMTSVREPGLWDDETNPVVEQDRRLISVTIPAPALTVHTLLEAGTGSERFFWAEPDDPDGTEGMRFAATGIAAELKVLPGLREKELDRDTYHLIQEAARQLFDGAEHYAYSQVDGSVSLLSGSDSTARPEFAAGPRLFGGFAFQPDFVPDNTWSTYHPAHFVLPHVVLTISGSERWLTIHATDHGSEPAAELAQALLIAVQARYNLLTSSNTPDRSHVNAQGSPVAQIRYPMTRTAWAEIVEQARQEIAAGRLEKVVLARVAELRLEGPIDPLQALVYLGDTYPTCFRFLFEPVPGHAFFGASPELLVRKNGRQIETMALAGSIGRGATEFEDRAQAEHLLFSAKDAGEHALVVQAIRSRLEPHVGQLEIPQNPGLLRFHNIQHLHTPIAGQLESATGPSLLDLVEELHPTPALGGVPRKEALSFLTDAEPVPRGWYAGPVGWFDAAQDGAFTVAIRSAVCQHNRAWLYAGAGIVGASDPELEWRETNLKFRPMLEALGQSGGVDND